MKNRVRQSRTLGSVRGEDGAAMVNLHGHVAGNGGHGQGEPTVATGPLLLGRRSQMRQISLLIILILVAPVPRWSSEDDPLGRSRSPGYLDQPDPDTLGTT